MPDNYFAQFSNDLWPHMIDYIGYKNFKYFENYQDLKSF